MAIERFVERLLDLEALLEDTLNDHLMSLENGEEDNEDDEATDDDGEDDDEEDGEPIAVDADGEPMDLTSEYLLSFLSPTPLIRLSRMLLWGREPMLNGQIERGVCMPAGEDLILMLIAPEPVALTHFTYVPHVEEKFEGYLQAFERMPSENDIKSVAGKPTFAFNMTDSRLAVVANLDPWVKGQFFILRFRGIQKLIYESLGSIGCALPSYFLCF